MEEGGSTVDVRDKHGATPLLLATQSGFQPTALYLAHKGADVEVSLGNLTVVSLDARSGRL